MNKLKVLAAIALVMAYIAGIATGWAGYTLADEHPPPPEQRGSWISHTLGLDEAQKAQMEAIWSKEKPDADGDDPRAKMKALYDVRNAEVRALLSEEQQQKFDAIYAAFDENRERLSQERRERHDDAIQKTMAILSPEQQERYQVLIEEFERKGPKRNHGPNEWPPGK